MRPNLTEEEIRTFRATVCRAAETLFARDGFEGVTMREIATEVGVSPTAAYRYFKNKDEILAAVRAGAFNRFCEVIEAAASSADVRRSARRVGTAYLDFALANPQAYKMMFDVKQDHVAQYPELAQALERANRCMLSYVEALISAGLLQGDAAALGRLLWASAHGLVMLRLSGIVETSEELQKLHQMSMSALVHGINSPAAARAGAQGRRALSLVQEVAPRTKTRKKA